MARLRESAPPNLSGEDLYCEAVPLAGLAARHGTPLYVYSAAMIRARLNAFAHAFRSIPHTLCYSVKANSTLAILRLVADEGAGFDVVSGGELERVLRASPKAAGKVVFSGVGKTAAEMELALRSGILLFNIESASELNLLSATATRLKKRAAVAVRVNPDVSAKTHPYISTGLHQHKFGVPIPEARTLYAQAAKQPYLKVAGVSVHIGSQITDVGSFQEALERVADLVRVLREAGPRHSLYRRRRWPGNFLRGSAGEFRETDCGVREGGAWSVARLESAFAARTGTCHRGTGGRVADTRPLPEDE